MTDELPAGVTPEQLDAVTAYIIKGLELTPARRLRSLFRHPILWIPVQRNGLHGVTLYPEITLRDPHRTQRWHRFVPFRLHGRGLLKFRADPREAHTFESMPPRNDPDPTP